MKPIFLSFLILSCCFSLSAQITAEQIKKSNLFYWGEGKASTFEQADLQALGNLANQIDVTVESQVRSSISQYGNIPTEQIDILTKTHTRVALTNTEKIVLRDKKGVVVLRYIARTQIKDIFEIRKKKIYGYISLGQKAESQLRIGDALKYYYWAYALLLNHPEGSDFTIELPQKKICVLHVWLPDCIRALLSRLSFDVNTIRINPLSKIYELDVKIDSMSLQNLDYTYWMGDSWSTLIHTKTGIAAVELFNPFASHAEQIRLRVELSNKAESKSDPDVQYALENNELPTFPQSEFILSFSPKQKIKDAIPVDSSSFYHKRIEKIHLAIHNKKYATVRDYFTDEGYRDFKRLIEEGNAVVLKNEKAPETIVYKGETMIRSYPMLFSFKTNQQRFIENVVYTFSDEKINRVSFAISNNTKREILDKSDSFGSTDQRYALLEMLERYKTAYCLRDAAYLEQIFADNALIIVGRMLIKGRPLDGLYAQANNVEYIRLNKNQFIERLKRTFRSNEFVNLKFDDTRIRKGKGEIYGIQLEQHYYSSSYSDHGYLFLMVDLNNPEKTSIYVRTWQPERESDGSIYGLEMFDVY